MRISIMAPGNSTMDFHHINVEQGRLIQPKGMDDDSFEAVKGIVAKALVRDNPAMLAGINPLDRIASVFERMEDHRQKDSYVKEELAAFKAKVLVKEYLTELLAAHASMALAMNLLPIEELVNSMEYEYRQIKLGDALEAVVKAVKEAREKALAEACTSTPRGEFHANGKGARDIPGFDPATGQLGEWERVTAAECNPCEVMPRLDNGVTVNGPPEGKREGR